MATLNFSTYAELQTSALNFMDRTTDTTEVKGFISLAEARLNRKLSAVETDTTLTGTASSRDISIASISMSQPIALKLVNDDGDEVDLVMSSLGEIDLKDDEGEPSQFAVDIDDDKIILDRPCDEAYSFRLIYRERFALSDSVTSNWLLTNHPDIYLGATLVWGAGYHVEGETAAAWKGLLEEGIDEVRHEIAQNKGSQLTTDPALRSIYPYRGLNLRGAV